MTQLVQDLIDKIKSEGVQAAENSANTIREKAAQDAESIVESARKEAQQIIADAEVQAKKVNETTQLALKQSARDTLLLLRKNIQSMLNGIIKEEVAKSLNSEILAKIIEAATKTAIGAKTVEGEVILDVNQDDLETLQEGFLEKLQDHLKKGMRLQASGTISKGFTISFDGARSSFEFTDESLAEYLGSLLNPQISELVKSSVEST